MIDLIEFVAPIIRGFDLRAFVDILIVAGIAYWLLSLIQGTTAVALLRGIAFVFIIGSLASNLLGLAVLGWLLRNSIPALLVAVPILFQPELRRALEEIGRAGRITRPAAATANQRTI
jgi:diadenylate cyclase